jgi:hypothetical protein
MSNLRFTIIAKERSTLLIYKIIIIVLYNNKKVELKWKLEK